MQNYPMQSPANCPFVCLLFHRWDQFIHRLCTPARHSMQRIEAKTSLRECLLATSINPTIFICAVDACARGVNLIFIFCNHCMKCDEGALRHKINTYYEYMDIYKWNDRIDLSVKHRNVCVVSACRYYYYFIIHGFSDRFTWRMYWIAINQAESASNRCGHNDLERKKNLYWAFKWKKSIKRNERWVNCNDNWLCMRLLNASITMILQTHHSDRQISQSKCFRNPRKSKNKSRLVDQILIDGSFNSLYSLSPLVNAIIIN